MPTTLSANTQAILLLTAPLMLGKGGTSAKAELLKPTEYQRLARHLVELGKQPADLLSSTADQVVEACNEVIPSERLRSLLARGFLLSQALDRWQARSIWVVSRADAKYPRLLKSKLKAKAPAVLYGCGNIELLGKRGVGVVGSRKVPESLMQYAADVGAIAAQAGHTVVSGGARGVDRAAMDGALVAGGEVVGVLAEELEREAMHRKNREALQAGRLVLVSEYDPSSRFTIGHAMQRNKLIYAFVEHALIVNSDLERGGTWAGAVEQLDKFRFATIFVRSTGPCNEALQALILRGARPWPNPTSGEALRKKLASAAADEPTACAHGAVRDTGNDAAGALFRVVEEVVLRLMDAPLTESEIANALNVTKVQAREWLHRLSQQGTIARSGSPIRYHKAQKCLLGRGETHLHSTGE